MRVARSGKPARTQVRELRCEQGLSLLLVELLTGRRHQIRVHLAHMGCPLLGDGLYGGPCHDGGLMLHAWEERLMHPVTGERLHLRTDVPDRFVRLFGEEPFA
jgi:23S rRNA pseudouridine1911/1915/1917 synthase